MHVAHAGSQLHPARPPGQTQAAFGLGTAAFQPTLDLAQLDVLMAVRAPEAEFGTPCDQTETMVSTVASRLGIDPSRASRVTSDLIRQGLVRRAVSQQDARRSVLELTEEGARLVSAVRTYKFLVLGSFLKDWTPEEVATFLSEGAKDPRIRAFVTVTAVDVRVP